VQKLKWVFFIVSSTPSAIFAAIEIAALFVWDVSENHSSLGYNLVNVYISLPKALLFSPHLIFYMTSILIIL